MESPYLEVPPEEAADLLTQARSFAELQLGRLTIHKEPGWLALPYPAGIGDFGDRELESLVQLARRAGSEELWVVTDEPRVFRAPALADRLGEVAEHFSLYDLAFLPASFAWQILASEAEFSVAIGDPADVTAFVSGTPEEAIEAFRRSALWWQNLPPLQEALMNAPWERYEALPPGADFEVTWPTVEA
jgi:hypothetical protein